MSKSRCSSPVNYGESASKEERKRSIARYIKTGYPNYRIEKLLWKINHTSHLQKGMNLVDFQSEVFDIIHTFSGQANKIVVNTVFIDLVDDLETGLFYHNLSIGRSYNKRGWLFL